MKLKNALIIAGVAALLYFLSSKKGTAAPQVGDAEEGGGGGSGSGFGLGIGATPSNEGQGVNKSIPKNEYQIFIDAVKPPVGLSMTEHLKTMGINYAGALAQYIIYNLKLSKDFAVGQISDIYGIDRAIANYIVNNSSISPTDLAKVLYSMGYSKELNATNVGKAFVISYNQAMGVVSVIYPTASPVVTVGSGISGVSVGSGTATPVVTGGVVGL